MPDARSETLNCGLSLQLEGPSERSASIEKNEDDCRAGKGDQRKSREIGDQVEIDAHGDDALSF